MHTFASRYLLPRIPAVDDRLVDRLRADYAAFAQKGMPDAIEDHLRNAYQLDVASTYGGFPIRNPWGKASGQLSMNENQIREDVEAGLGFVVLKTVIAQDSAGDQSMRDWAVKEARMSVEPIVGESGEEGWTVSWRGRGWWQTFDEYLELVRRSAAISTAHAAASSRAPGTLVVPSCKYHLPGPGEETWRTEEYRVTTRTLLDAWRAGMDDPLAIMPLEKDFSPTLAGSDRAQAKECILSWLRSVPRLVRASCPQGAADIRVGLKMLNALFDDDFQVDMLRTIHERSGDQPGGQRPDFFVYANRLFDPLREFDSQRGIAYGGPDLSDRNLRVMAHFQQQAAAGRVCLPLLPWSATGNILSGKMALEYALCGASSFQLHTFFQLPAEVYTMRSGTRTQKALHELYFHPQTGLVVWMHHVAGVLGLSKCEPIRFCDLVGRALEMIKAGD